MRRTTGTDLRRSSAASGARSGACRARRPAPAPQTAATLSPGIRTTKAIAVNERPRSPNSAAATASATKPFQRTAPWKMDVKAGPPSRGTIHTLARSVSRPATATARASAAPTPVRLSSDRSASIRVADDERRYEDEVGDVPEAAPALLRERGHPLEEDAGQDDEEDRHERRPGRRHAGPIPTSARRRISAAAAASTWIFRRVRETPAAAISSSAATLDNRSSTKARGRNRSASSSVRRRLSAKLRVDCARPPLAAVHVERQAEDEPGDPLRIDEARDGLGVGGEPSSADGLQWRRQRHLAAAQGEADRPGAQIEPQQTSAQAGGLRQRIEGDAQMIPDAGCDDHGRRLARSQAPRYRRTPSAGRPPRWTPAPARRYSDRSASPLIIPITMAGPTCPLTR